VDIACKGPKQTSHFTGQAIAMPQFFGILVYSQVSKWPYLFPQTILTSLCAVSRSSIFSLILLSPLPILPQLFLCFLKCFTDRFQSKWLIIDHLLLCHCFSRTRNCSRWGPRVSCSKTAKSRKWLNCWIGTESRGPGDRDFQAHLGSLSESGLQRQIAIDQPRPLLHSYNPDAGSRFGGIFCQSDSKVFNR
jgi:hypothetical protein